MTATRIFFCASGWANDLARAKIPDLAAEYIGACDEACQEAFGTLAAGSNQKQSGNLPIEPSSTMDLSVSFDFRSSSKKWMARCAAGVGANEKNAAYIVEGIIFTVY